jgi:hypothetical protein
MTRACRPLLGVVTLIALVGAAGCYLSPIPLSAPSQPLDERLFGLWRCVPGEPSDEHAMLRIVRFDEHQYYADWTDEERVTRYRAYATILGSTTLLNVQELKDTTSVGSWMFVKYALPTTSQLTLSVAQDTAVKGGDDRARLDAVRKGAAAAALFGKPAALCTRQAAA